MGNVAISITIVPNGPEVDIEDIKRRIREKIDVKDMKEEDIGFGLKNIKIMVIRPDVAGQGTDDLEEELSKIDGVSSVRVDDVTLI
ncbi:MAG: elongation factor 1-beta [Candidatus Aenigmarchaeota archaeon]|nr:elongation factor 1-beta [Candidatus Aenigmarchaeota archaeon]